MAKTKAKQKKCKECKMSKPINKFRRNAKAKDGCVSVCEDCIGKKTIKTKRNIQHANYYVYRFLDKDDNIIYVGKTVNMLARMRNHIGKALSLKLTENEFLMYPNVYKIEYCEVESDYCMNIYEIHYICKYNPPFNVDYKSTNQKLFNLPELTWDLYVFKSYIENVQRHHIMKFGNAISIKSKMKRDPAFYKKIINQYLECDFVHTQFSDYDIISEYYPDEIEEEDSLDFCSKNYDCDAECEDCDDKGVTWRDIYNQKIKESKDKIII